MKRFGLGSLVILTAFFVIPSFGQGMYEAWVARYNGPVDSTDVATAIRVDGSGNAYMTGSSYGIGTDRDYLTIKYSPTGDTLWTRRYNGPGNGPDMANALSVDGSGNVCATGGSWGGTSRTDFATIKYYSNGNIAWARRYSSPADSDDVAHALAVDNFGLVYVAGVAARDYATVKYDSSGNQVWVKTYDGTLGGWDEIWAVTVDDSGNVYVTGESEGIGSSDLDYVTIKYYPSGDTVWVRRYNGPGDGFDVARAIAVDDSGNVYVTGSSEGSGTSNDIATIKYYPDGNTAWVRTFNGTGNGYDGALSISLDALRNIYVAGSTYSGPATIDDYVIIKHYSNGDTAWVRTYDGPPNGYDGATAILTYDSNSVYVTGWSAGIGTWSDYATLKYDQNGNLIWVRRYNGPTNYEDNAHAMDVDQYLNVYVTGTSGISGQNYDYATIKYVPPAPIYIQAFSPVDLIVTDLDGDSIGVSFNTIPEATYTVANDSVFIPAGKPGNYRIRVIKDTLELSGDTSYTVEARIDGTYDRVLAADRPVPAVGQSDYYGITYNPPVPECTFKPGDANADAVLTLADIIRTVNYIFNKPGYPGCGSHSSLCWLTGLLCRGDWNATLTVSLVDVIWGVNYIFNKPGGPWNPIPSGACCLPVP